MTARQAPPTLADVARAAGVSLATASRVLGHSDYRVSDGLRAKVAAAAAELRYVPNAHAQALARASTSTVGLIVHDVSDPYFSEIARGVLRGASERDRLVMICNSFRDPERELTYIAALRAQRVHAIILAGSGFVDPLSEAGVAEELLGFAAGGGRVALVGRHGMEVDAVQPDNVHGARRVGWLLADLGHRHVGVVAGPASLTTIEDRLAGFRDGLHGRDLSLLDDRVVHADFTRAGGYDATRRLLRDHDDVTAIFALNDSMAIGTLAALAELGVAVPAQISVVGFDDIPFAADTTPALTTVRIPMEDMGYRAVALALGDGDAPPRTIPTSSQLVERASTAVPPADDQPVPASQPLASGVAGCGAASFGSSTVEE